jgi:hypothetical protein
MGRQLSRTQAEWSGDNDGTVTDARTTVEERPFSACPELAEGAA